MSKNFYSYLSKFTRELLIQVFFGSTTHTYSWVTAKTFSELIRETLEAYIDNTATYSDTFEDHLVHLRKTFEAAMKTGIKLKASKCYFFYPEIKFIGHLVSKKGIQMMPEK